MDDHRSRQAATLSRRDLLIRLGIAGASTAAIPFLAACQAAAPGAAASASGAAAATGAAVPPATITWSFWGGPTELPPNDEVIKAFNAKYPQIKITKFHEPFASYFDKITTMFAGNTAPDVLFLNNVPTYAGRGVLEPLDPFVKQSNYDVQDFVQAEMKLFQYQGKTYGFPRDNDTKVLYFNKDAFDEAKLAYPDASWDWKKLREAAAKLTKRDGDRIVRYGAAIEATEWPSFVWTNGGDVYDDPLKPTKCLLDQPAQVEAITFLADLINKDKTIASATSLTQAGGVTTMFGGGLAAMAISNAPRLLAFAKASFKWDVSVLPKQKRAVNYIGGAGYVMSAQSKQKEAAWTFMQFLNGPEAQRIFSAGGGVVPSRVSVQKSDSFLKSGPPGVDMQTFVTATSQGYLNGASTIGPWQAEMSQTVNKELDAIWSGQADPATQLPVIAKNATARLATLVK